MGLALLFSNEGLLSTLYLGSLRGLVLHWLVPGYPRAAQRRFHAGLCFFGAELIFGIFSHDLPPNQSAAAHQQA